MKRAALCHFNDDDGMQLDNKIIDIYWNRPMQLSFVGYSVTLLFNDIMQSRCEFKIFTDELRIIITSIWLTPHAYVSDCADYLDSIA